jgi:shikimate kinase
MADGTHPFLVEITGVAGSGKSTITRLICEAEPDHRRAGFIHARNPRHLAAIVRGMPRLLPMLVRNLGPGPRLSWADVKLLVYVTEWRRLLAREPEYRQGVTLLDQGPIYSLVRLRAQGKKVTSTATFERWWDEMIEVWAGELAAVIYLDASDQVLWDRINGREQPHRTKGEPASVGQDFITRYRRLFEEVLGRAARPGGPEILRFDTSATAGQQIAAEIRSILATRVARRVAGSEAQR